MHEEDDEPLFRVPKNKYAFRVQYPHVYDMYQQALACFWTSHEPDYNADAGDWDNKLTEDERRFLSYVLAFFATADGIVNENLEMNFCQEVQPVEARMFYDLQKTMENVHMEVYADMLRAFIRDDAEINKLIDAVHTMPCIAKKAQWAQRYMNRETYAFPMRVLAFAVMEGVMFSSAFASIFHFKKRGLMPGLAFANTLISRDEGLHCEFACEMFRMCVRFKPTREEVHNMMREAVSVEEEFVRDAIPVALIGINADMMCAYVRYCADRLLMSVRYDAIWNEKNPFDFMTLISVPLKTNFFEGRTGEYNKTGVMAEDMTVVVNEEF